MAGGEGTRLRPLTCNLPKPMMPVANRPMMEHIVQLLKKHDITDIAVTLQYLPDHIQDHFGNGSDWGVHMHYYVEKTPLGTAGSVQNAKDFLDDTFVVISGDCLTDFDISKAVEFHRQKGALATLVLTRVDCPLEYGVVITDKEHHIVKFLEKPGWGEVFSDTVNTGLYILEPEAMAYVKPGKKFDFSQDLFPLLLQEKRPLFGLTMEGYWCDIGDLKAYLQAHMDILSRKVAIEIAGKEISPGVWAADGADISESATVIGPTLIGKDTVIEKNARIEPYTLLGNGCVIKERATIKRSVLWNNVFVGQDAALRGAVLCNGVQIQDKANVYEGAVVGADSVVKENGMVKPDVKLWPHKVVEKGSVVHSSMVWGTRYPKKIFGLEGVSGLTNVEMTPEFALRVAAAYAFSLGTGKNKGLAISCDSAPASTMIKSAVLSGVQSVGLSVYDLGCGITPLNRFAVRSFNLAGGIHIKTSSYKSGHLTMVCIDENGANIARSKERKVENILLREDFSRADCHKIQSVVTPQHIDQEYLDALVDAIGHTALRDAGFTLVVAYTGAHMQKFIEPLAHCLGVHLLEPLDLSNKGDEGSIWRQHRDILEQMKEAVVKLSADAGVLLEGNGDGLILMDQKGRIISDDLLTALSALVVLKSKGGPVVVPVTASGAIDELAQRYQGKVVRTKTSVQDFAEKILHYDSLGGKKEISQFHLHFDALGALFSLLDYAVAHGFTLAQMVDEIPSFFMHKGEVAVPWETKGTVIRKLIEDPPTDHPTELLDGVKVYHPQGWSLVLPDPEEPLCRVFSEGASMEIAESLTEFYVEKINRMINK